MKKRIISSVVSLSVLSLSVAAVMPADTVSAEETKNPEIQEWQFGFPEEEYKLSEEGSLEEIIASYGEDAFVCRSGDSLATIITPYGGVFAYRDDICYSVITMKDGTEPPAELLNQRTFYKYHNDNQYICHLGVDKYYDILKEDENVLSLDAYHKIIPVPYGFDSLEISGDISAEEFINEYSALNLTLSPYSDDEHISLKFDHHTPVTPEVYAAFMKLQNSGIDYKLSVVYALIDRVTDTLFLEHVITSEEDNISDNVTAVSGDINADGKVDVTDLTELSLALLGDTELTSAQQQSADVDGSGEVKLADLATLKQYLSKQIDSLG